MGERGMDVTSVEWWKCGDWLNIRGAGVSARTAYGLGDNILEKGK